MTATWFGEKLRAAISRVAMHGARTRLHNLVYDELMRRQSESVVAHRVSDAIDDDPALLVEIIDEAQFRDALVERFVSRYAKRLRERGHELPRKRDGAGHGGVDAQFPSAGTDKQNGGDAASRAGQLLSDSQNEAARPATSSPSGDGGGQNNLDSQSGFAPAAETAAGGGPRISDDHTGDAATPASDSAPAGHSPDGNHCLAARRGTPANRLPGRARHRSSSAVRKAQAEINHAALDRIMVNGVKLRHAKPGDALQQAERRRIEAWQIEAICAGLEPTSPVGDQISDSEANARLKKAQEAKQVSA